MASIVFHKACGTGNDFILIDNRKGDIKNRASLAKEVCHRHVGAGADGLILFEKSKKADITMRIFNADGSEAEMCGNGIRCAAWVAHHVLSFKKDIRFETKAGIISCAVSKKSVRVALTEPTGFRDYAPLEVQDGIFYFYFINTGVPHCVIFEDALDDFPVERIGREIRNHAHFQPAGTNVNFVQIVDNKTIKVRTYERGVEAETLACGTGSTASAIISALIEKCTPPVTVLTKSGEKLCIDFSLSKFSVSQVYLEGPVSYICEGILPA